MLSNKGKSYWPQPCRLETVGTVTIWTVSRNGDGYRLDAAQSFSCLVGKAGLIAATDKREGDGDAIGDWPLRRVYYRPDRVALPATALPSIALTPTMGWCDDPQDAKYNMPVELPFTASHERLWREDGLYDFIVVLAIMTSLPTPLLGSAVFLHLREQDTPHTAGCVAIAKDDMLALLGTADTKTILRVSDDGPEERRHDEGNTAFLPDTGLYRGILRAASRLAMRGTGSSTGWPKMA